MTNTNPFHPRNPDQIAQAITEWYGIHAPSITSAYFNRFASHSHELAKIVSNRGWAHIEIVPAPTASVDLSTQTIHLPLYYFSHEAMSKVAGTDDEALTSACSIASINGSTTHEALHLLLTHANPLEACNAVNPTIVKRYGEQLACTYMNIAEDLFIENTGYTAAFGKFLHMKNAILFTREQFAQSMAEAASAMGTKTEAIAAVNALVCLKNTAFVDDPLWATNAKLASAAKMMLTARTSADRAKTALEVLSLFQVPDRDDKGGEGAKSDESEGMSSPATATEEQAAEIAEKDDDAKESAEKFENKGEAKDGPNFVMLSGSLEEYDIPNYPYLEGRRPNYYTPSNFANFARLLRQLRVRNHAPGSPRNKGSKIVCTRLARIGTDGKIFANMDGTKQETRLEVILLCDASGSMSTCVIGSSSRWMVVHEVAKEVHHQLKKAGIANSVYAHTSDESGKVPTVAHVVSTGMRTNNQDWEARFERAYRINLCNNFDGVAIKCVSKKFTNRPAHKVLIVLSDGQPAGDNYGGEEAKKHTREQIAEARKAGVSVICFSLDSGVVRPNNELYGKENNIDCSGTNLEPEFRRVIANIVAEGR